jgi:hypothetical protein
MEKCYRIHGFPPGYKFNKGKNASPSVHRVSGPQLPITYEQCQQLINMFKPSISEHDSSINQVSLFASKESEIPMQGEGMTCAGDSLITAQSSILYSTHSVFASFLSLPQQSSITNPATTPWIIDTGATDHMICSTSFFTSITSVVSKSVRLPNGQFASVTHIGIINISECFVLIDVLCIPSFSFNLISISKLIKTL